MSIFYNIIKNIEPYNQTCGVFWERLEWTNGIPLVRIFFLMSSRFPPQMRWASSDSSSIMVWKATLSWTLSPTTPPWRDTRMNTTSSWPLRETPRHVQPSSCDDNWASLEASYFTSSQVWYAGFSWCQHRFPWPRLGHRPVPNGHQKHNFGYEGELIYEGDSFRLSQWGVPLFFGICCAHFSCGTVLFSFQQVVSLFHWNSVKGVSFELHS